MSIERLFGEDPNDGKLHVHVDNTDDFGITRTEEKEPEHFSFATYSIAPAGTQYADGSPSGYAQVNLDLARKSIAVLNTSSTSPVILCHTLAQVKDPANYATPLVAPSGALIPAGGNAGMDGTGGFFIVNPSAGTVLVSVIVNRRGNA